MQRIGDIDTDTPVQVRHGAHGGRNLGGEPIQGDRQIAIGLQPLGQSPSGGGGGQSHPPADDVDVGQLLGNGLEQCDRFAELFTRGYMVGGQPGGAVDESVGVAGQGQPVVIAQHRRVDAEDVAARNRDIGEGDRVFARTAGRRGAPHVDTGRVAGHNDHAVCGGDEEGVSAVGMQYTGFRAGECAVDDPCGGPRGECVTRLGGGHRVPGTACEWCGEAFAGGRVGRTQGECRRNRADGRGHRGGGTESGQQRRHAEYAEIVTADRFREREREQSGVDQCLPQLGVVIVGRVRGAVFPEGRFAECGRPLGLVP